MRTAESLLVKEKEQKKTERENALNERVPPLKLSGLSVQELQVLNMFQSQCVLRELCTQDQCTHTKMSFMTYVFLLNCFSPYVASKVMYY